MFLGDKFMIITFLRTIILYILIIIAFKIMGKRQIGDLQPSELVITILVSDIATLPIENSQISMFVAMIPIFTLVAFEVIMSYLSIKVPSFRTILTGQPVVLIENGNLNQSVLKNNRFAVEDILEELRLKDIFDIQEVELATIETNGKMSIYKKQEKDTPTREDFKLIPQTKKPSYAIIVDGKINKKNLSICNLTEKWLQSTLEKEKIKSKDVFLMSCDSQCQYSIIKRNI